MEKFYYIYFVLIYSVYFIYAIGVAFYFLNIKFNRPFYANLISYIKSILSILISLFLLYHFNGFFNKPPQLNSQMQAVIRNAGIILLLNQIDIVGYLQKEVSDLILFPK